MKFAGVSGDSETESKNEVREDNSDDDHQAERETCCQLLTGLRNESRNHENIGKFYAHSLQSVKKNLTGLSSSSTGGTAGRAINTGFSQSRTQNRYLYTRI